MKSFKLLSILALTACTATACAPRSQTTQVTMAPVANLKTVTRHVSPGPKLKDPAWVADPANYEQTATIQLNNQVQVPILEYHEANYTPGNAITLKPGQLLQEVQWLHSHDFHTINFGQLYAAFYYGYKLPPRPVLLTFDDGYESVYFEVFPVLKQYGFQATVFAVSNFVHAQPNRAVKYPKLTSSELQIMQKSGVIDVESHTVHHPDLSKLTDSRATFELTESQAALQKIVGHPVLFFCYPFGSWTNRTVVLVKNAGYLLATSQTRGYASLQNGPLTLHRISVFSTDTLQDFAHKLNPSLQAAPSVQQAAKLFHARHYAQAIAMANQVLQQDPNNSDAYNIRGIATCYSALDTAHYNLAMADIQRAITLNPKNGYAWFNEALCEERFAHYDAALATYHKAIPLCSTHWKVWSYYGIASIYGRRGDVSHTVQYLKQAIALNPNVKQNARTEPDFNPVRGSAAFQALLH